MAFTKLYLTAVTPGFTPTNVRGTWDDPAGLISAGLSPTKRAGGVATSVARSETSATNPFKVLLFRGISSPLAAQTIAGTINLMMGALESAADADMFLAAHVYVTAGDTDTVRATLLANYAESATNEFPTTATALQFQVAQPMTSSPIADGDRLVVELGYVARNATATSKTGTLRYGTVDGSGLPLGDLTAGSTAVTTLAGFLEFNIPLQESGTLVSKGVFVASTAAGPQNIIGVGFRPKAVLVWATGQIADGVTDVGRMMIGFTDGSRQALRSLATNDNTVGQAAMGFSEQKILMFLNPNGTIQAAANFLSMDSDGFSINWSTNDGSARFIHYLAIGGPNVSARIGVILSNPGGTTTPQTQDVTGVGFTPTAVLTLPSFSTLAEQVNPTNGGLPAFGFASIGASIQNANTHVLTRPVTSTDNYSRQTTTTALNAYTGNVGGALAFEAAVSAVGADGFTLTWSTLTGTTARMYFLALTGFRAAVFSGNKPTSPGDSAVTGMGFRPVGVIMSTAAAPASAAAIDGAHVGVGAADYQSQGSAAMGELDNQATSVSARTFSSTKALQMFTPAATGASSAIIGEATVKSFDADGLTLNWNVADGTARQFIGLAFGPAVAVAPPASGCTGGGTVPAGIEPPSTSSLAGNLTPLVYLTLDTASGTQSYGRVAIVDSTFREARIMSIGPIRRALSDWFGGYQTASCSVVLYDTDRAIRALHVAGTLMNRKVNIYMTSAAILAASGQPRKLGQFVVRRYQPLGDFTFSFDLEDFLGSQLGEFSSQKKLPFRVFNTTDFPTLGNATDHPTDPGNPSLIGKAVPIGYGELSDTALGAAAQGVIPCHYVGTRQLGGGGAEKWDEYVVFGHAMKNILEWFAAATPVDQRIKMDVGTEGVDFLIPGSAGWTARLGANKFVDYNFRRYTVIYARGPRSAAAREGRVPITLNGCGIEATGDGTGNVVSGIVQQAMHLINNFIIQRWETGAWLITPLIVDDFSFAAIRTSTFEAAQTISAARIAGGYLGAWILAHDLEPVGLFDLLQRLCLSGDFDLGINAHGQIIASMLDAAAGAVASVTDQLDILQGSLTPNLVFELMANDYRYNYQRRYVQPITNPTPAEGVLLPGAVATPIGDWLATGTDTDATSITNHQETKPITLDLAMVRDPLTAANVVLKRKDRTKVVPVMPNWKMGLRGADLDLGDVITVTAASGLSATGWTDRRIRVREVEIDPISCTTTPVGHDIADL